MNRAPAVVSVLLWLAAGCGGLEADGTACIDDGPCGRDIDAGTVPPFEDGAVSTDAGAGAGDIGRGIPASPEDGAFAGESPTRDDYDPASCYDGIDNDATGGLDCADPGCTGLGACCVGSGDCCAAVAGPPLPSLVTLPASCPGDPTASCLAGLDVTAFGDPGPRVVDGVLYPGGDASYDSGLVIGAPVDLSAMRVSLQTSFHAPTDCGATCLEGAGIAFTEQETFGDSTFVRPLVGLLTSGSRRDVRLVVADAAVASWPLADGEGPFELVLSPDGTVEVLRDGASLHSTSFPTTASARLVVYGRNRNPSAADPNGSGVGTLTTNVELCDMPAAWRVREQLFVAQPPTMAELDTGRMRAPSVAEDGAGRLTLVFEDGAVMRAARRGSEPHRFTMLGDVAFEPGGEPWIEGGVSDPELLWDGSGFELFFTATDVDGKTSIGRASAADPAAGFTGAAPLLTPEEGVDGYSMPTVIRLWYEPTTWILIVRADLADGTHELRTFVSGDDGASFERFEEDRLPSLTSRGGPESRGGFDADEIAAPSILVHNGAYHLYYAGRRGTRWRIGMLASDELVYWRAVNGGAAIMEGDGNGLDRLGVSDPDVVVQGITVELFYTGTDGARDTLFRGVRSAAEEASR